MGYGRRRALLIAGIIFTVGGILSQVMRFSVLAVSRLIEGFASGVTFCAVNRAIEEFVPLAMYATASPFNVFMG